MPLYFPVFCCFFLCFHCSSLSQLTLLPSLELFSSPPASDALSIAAPSAPARSSLLMPAVQLTLLMKKKKKSHSSLGRTICDKSCIWWNVVTQENTPGRLEKWTAAYQLARRGRVVGGAACKSGAAAVCTSESTPSSYTSHQLY